METTATFHPGDIVTSRTGRPPKAEPTDQFVVVGASPSGANFTVLTRGEVQSEPGWGWSMNEREGQGPVSRAVDGLPCWHIRREWMTKVADHEARLDPALELARRRIQIAEGFEPVLQCRASNSDMHPPEPHRHSVSGANQFGRGYRMHRRADVESEHTPVPGLWGKGAHVTTSHSVTPEPEVAVPTEATPEKVDLHPLTLAAIRDNANRTVRLESITGELRGDRVVFGCQEWALSRLPEGSTFVKQAGFGVKVTSPATLRSDGYIYVGDRTLGAADVNRYTEHIWLDGTAPEVQPENAVVLEHGFYGCATHTGEHIIIVASDNLRNSAVGMLNQITRAGGRLNGQVMRRHGFAGTAYRDCVPVASSTTISNMELNTEQRWAAIPVRPEMVEQMRTAGLRMVHLTGEQVQRCDEQGNVVGERFDGPLAA